LLKPSERLASRVRPSSRVWTCASPAPTGMRPKFVLDRTARPPGSAQARRTHREPVVEETGSVAERVLPVRCRRVAEDHGDQGSTIPPGGGHEALAGPRGEAGLDAEGALVLAAEQIDVPQRAGPPAAVAQDESVRVDDGRERRHQ